MGRPVTLFTGQWADLPVESILERAKALGYDGIELACWGDHFERELLISPPVLEPPFFSTCDLNSIFEKEPFASIISNAHDLEPSVFDLIHSIATTPDSIHKLSGLQFEKLIAELAKSEGGHVELTQQSHDNGVDLRVHGQAFGVEVQFIIQCKQKQKPERAVGVEEARNLLGTVVSNRASFGVLATTGRLTKAALKFIRRNCQHLQAWTKSKIVKMARGYIRNILQHATMSRSEGLSTAN